MVKLFSILMSSLMLIQSFGITFGDIVQLDEFMEHANFHAEKYGDNLLVFISKHYGELKEQHSNDHKEEKRDHENLPFQNNGHCTSSSFAIVFSTFSSELKSLQNLEDKVTNFYYPLPSSSLHSTGTFQPPRFV
ncbi:hypothetical protein [uncultured Kriegella sp.]|uniref:hypothetical protein n=1 Tax=uncultured Kriegella sp. TaxID=1798910 RepID=UPI0030D8E2FA